MRIVQVTCQLLSVSFLIFNVESKFQSLHCNMIDKDWGEFKLCRIKAISRNRNSINLEYIQKYYNNDVWIRVEYFKRLNGWRPFLYNYKGNVCAFLKNRNNLLMKLAYEYIKPYTNFNHSCPLLANETIRVSNYEIDVDHLRVRFPIENGEYAMHTTWYHKNIPKLTLNGSILYYNYRTH
ncbi:uncharacterized protein Dwil_GK26990 [Drosophila willistoni]|uniref:MD-2-related lipid-recognition domain-containing protein n=1 Tax=Drosophila willistoni TaxID=7260 RepID=A0A0Q9WYA8_DROWI|nr:uncharacterized protein Dwil_GK26990 [Drosophila willistoni]